MIKVFADGSVRNGNPGIGGIGVVINFKSPMKYSGLTGDGKTNNEAEYLAVLKALEMLKEWNIDKEECTIIVDSKLVCEQVKGTWQCNYAHLELLRDNVRNMISECPFNVKIQWKRREHNEANDLAQAVTEREKVRRQWLTTK